MSWGFWGSQSTDKDLGSQVTRTELEVRVLGSSSALLFACFLLLGKPWGFSEPKFLACMSAKSLQSCPVLWDLMDCSLPGSSSHGILQARELELVAMPSSGGSSQPRDRTRVSCLLHRHTGSLPLAPPGKPLSIKRWKSFPCLSGLLWQQKQIQIMCKVYYMYIYINLLDIYQGPTMCQD